MHGMLSPTAFPWHNVLQIKDKTPGHVHKPSPKESCGATKHQALAVRQGGKSRTNAHSIRLSRASKQIYGMEAIAASGECVNSTILSIHPTV